ncbi:MAG: M12 family metallo-peptidase [Xanthomonadaceae bacterium]|jgi:hypothetical protein|nr:M12 family metallo-peptidase [Xanthomonadaceae bacterium]
MRRLHALFAFLLAPAVVAAAPQARILGYETLEIPAAMRAEGPARTTLTAFGRRFDLLTEPNASLLDALPDTVRAAATAGGNQFLRGTLDGVPGSWVRLSTIDGRWTGGFFDGKELYLVDAAVAVEDLLPAPAAPGSTVIYRFSDLLLPSLFDEVIAVDPDYPVPGGKRLDYAAFAGHLAAASGLGKGATRQLRLTVVTDVEYGTVHGANRDAVTASRVNFVDGVYTGQLDVQVTATTVNNLASNGAMAATSGSTLLGEFRTFMTSGAGSGIPKGGLNQLFSGKDFDGNVVGVAYLGVLCSSSFGYGVNQVRAANNTTALTIAHEMGHNFGAPHDGESGSACQAQTGNWLMSPSLNGSSTFSPCTLTQMADDISRATCLVDISGNIFRNSFEP